MSTEKQGIDDESLFRLAAAAIHEQLAEEESIAGEEITFSEQEIQKSWGEVMRKYRRKKFEESIKRYFRRTAAAAAAILLVASGSLVTVRAVSPSIREIVLTDFGQYSTLDMVFSGKQAEIPEDWQEQYYPRYIPKKFTYKETKGISKVKSLVYANSEGNYLNFTVIFPGAQIDIDTEDMEQTKIIIKEHEAILFKKLSKFKSAILINYEDCVIYISGAVSEDEIIKIAESISEK